MRRAALTPRWSLAVQAAATAVVSLTLLKLVGAPDPAPALQAAAFGLGGVLALGLGWKAGPAGPRLSIWLLGGAFVLILLSLADPGLEGVRRWFRAGPLVVQPAPLILPFVAWVLAGRPANWTVAGLAGAVAVLFAAQPDPSAAGALAAISASVLLARRRAGTPDLAILILSLAAFGWASTRPDPLAPVAHVEGIVAAAWSLHPAAGGVALIVLLLVPAPFLLRALASKGEGEARRALTFALSGLWLVLVLANLTGRFPAPVVGYGASFVLGWLVSLGLVAGRGASPVRAWRVEKRGAMSAT